MLSRYSVSTICVVILLGTLCASSVSFQSSEEEFNAPEVATEVVLKQVPKQDEAPITSACPAEESLVPSPLSQPSLQSPNSPGSPPPSLGGTQQRRVLPNVNAPQRPAVVERVAPPAPLYRKPDCPNQGGDYTINFKDVSVIELINFISKISGTNYIFNSRDLEESPNTPFKVTIVSQDATSVENLSAALLQILKIHGLSVAEEGNNVLIFRNKSMSKLSTVITNDNTNEACDKAIVTRVFQLYNVDATKIADIIKRLVSPEANVEASIETRHLIVTDITANVNKIADLLQALDTPNLAVDVADYRVQNADPMALAEYAKEILAPLAHGMTFALTPEPASRTIFIVSTPFIVQKAMQVLSSLDVAEISTITPGPLPSTEIKNNSFKMYKLKYHSGQLIGRALREIGTNLKYTGVGNIDFINTIYSSQWVEPNNSIVLTGTNDAIEKVIALIDDLDKQPKQVFIEVLIIDTTLTNSLDFGVQWIALGDEQDKLAFASGLLANAGPASGFNPGSTLPNNPNLQGTTQLTNPGARFVAANNGPLGFPPAIPNPGRDVALPSPGNLSGPIGTNLTEAFGLGFIGNILRHNGQSFLTLGALLSALDEEEDTTIVLNPRVMVEDTQTADFFVGQNIPYQTTSTVIQQTGSVTQNIQYEDIGIELRVTPTISPDNIVTMDITQSVSDIIGQAGQTNLTPITSKILATTRVHVPDGTFLVMSGHIRDQCSMVHSGIPCLGTLPLIGPLFGRSVELRTKRNLIFFIRPKVVTSPQEGVELTNQEGYDFNWETDPCSILNEGCPEAPEAETYPSMVWPPPPFYPGLYPGVPKGHYGEPEECFDEEFLFDFPEGYEGECFECEMQPGMEFPAGEMPSFDPSYNTP